MRLSSEEIKIHLPTGNTCTKIVSLLLLSTEKRKQKKPNSFSRSFSWSNSTLPQGAHLQVYTDQVSAWMSHETKMGLHLFNISTISIVLDKPIITTSLLHSGKRSSTAVLKARTSSFLSIHATMGGAVFVCTSLQRIYLCMFVAN